MTENNDRYGRTLIRLLHECRYAISMRNAYNELCRVAPTTSWGFFSYASIALYNDMFSHSIKLLDKHKDASSFWYIYRYKGDIVKSAVDDSKTSISEIKNISYKLRLIRDKTHFHIDKKKVFSPGDVWKEAEIIGDEFNKVLDGLWQILNSIHLEHFNEKFIQPIYDGKDVEKIVDLSRNGGVDV